MEYRFKSTTGSDILHINSGLNIPAADYVTCEVSDVAKLFDAQLIDLLQYGQIVFNNGKADQSYDKAMSKVEWTGANFSYTAIDDGDTVIIPKNQQMVVQGDFELEGNSTLDLSGEVVISAYH